MKISIVSFDRFHPRILLFCHIRNMNVDAGTSFLRFARNKVCKTHLCTCVRSNSLWRWWCWCWRLLTSHALTGILKKIITLVKLRSNYHTVHALLYWLLWVDWPPRGRGQEGSSDVGVRLQSSNCIPMYVLWKSKISHACEIKMAYVKECYFLF